ncbi:hypothetical protein SASPL_115750 [Salvia splendens]|uniref:Uncharacterized protein n=1 Tax=Salvia splendens TaxID=180675 RepID=A0A8X9A1L1_SALSN|nr:hypothetical protein SASPL_115750 [Salvia splendens]
MELPPDVMNVQATYENHIGLLLAEFKYCYPDLHSSCSVLAASLAFSVFIKQAQIPAQEVAIPVSSLRHKSDYMTITDDEWRKMLTQVFIDSAILRKQADSILCCALYTADTSPDSTQTE